MIGRPLEMGMAEEVKIDEASMKIGSIDFELFTDMKGSKQANAAMNKEIAKAAKMKDYKSARTYMNKVQDKYQKFGAGDSEPERTIDAVLAKSFSNDPDRRKHSFDFRREDVEVIDGYFEEQKSSTGYDLYHKDFSGAMQHAYAHAKKKLGITIDPDEISDKVATGPSKPSKGKTNSYRLKGDKGSVQIQVYNMGSKFELNMYKEEVEIDEEFELQEASIQMVAKDVEKLAKEVGKKDMDYSDFIKVAKMMRSNQEKDMVKYVGGLDTAPRDEIIMMVKNILGKKTAEKMFKVSIFGEEVELDEAKSQGMFIVLEKGSKNKVIGQFKDKRKAVDMMKKNAGSKVIQIGKFATADDKPVDIKVGDELSYTRVKLATKVKEEVEIDESVKLGGMPAGISKERIKADRDVYAQVLGIKEALDPADFDIKSTSKDREQADSNIMIQLQKVITLRGQKPVEFANGKKEKVHPNVAAAALSMHRKLRRTDEKDAFQRKLGKSYRDLLNAVKGK